MLTTVQDLGRWGHQAQGVPVAGAMDEYSHRLANRLVSNPDEAAAIEVTLVGPEIEATTDMICAVAGAEFELQADGRPVACGRPFQLRAGSRLRFGRRVAGARATFAVRGGIDVPAVLGSRSTSLISRMGPFGGRALAAGDVLGVAYSPLAQSTPPGKPMTLPQGGARLRAIPGPQDGMFTPAALELLFSSRFTITPRSNRMGYRLEGAALAHREMGDVLSDATPPGTIQVPRSGQPILLMADRQTTGGYPRIATVISADMPVAGQLAPGDWVRFAPCSRREAVDALRRMQRRLAGQTW
jgi:antagonist of KipI